MDLAAKVETAPRGPARLKRIPSSRLKNRHEPVAVSPPTSGHRDEARGGLAERGCALLAAVADRSERHAASTTASKGRSRKSPDPFDHSTRRRDGLPQMDVERSTPGRGSRASRGKRMATDGGWSRISAGGSTRSIERASDTSRSAFAEIAAYVVREIVEHPSGSRK